MRAIELLATKMGEAVELAASRMTDEEFQEAESKSAAVSSRADCYVLRCIAIMVHRCGPNGTDMRCRAAAKIQTPRGQMCKKHASMFAVVKISPDAIHEVTVRLADGREKNIASGKLPQELEELVDEALKPMDEAQLNRHRKNVEKIMKAH